MPLLTGLPQGSVLGTFSFPLYGSPLFDIASHHGIEIHMYADDTQLYVPFLPSEYDVAVTKMESCIAEMREWMTCNNLKLNDSKTEFLVIGKEHIVSRIESSLTITIGDTAIEATKCA